MKLKIIGDCNYRGEILYKTGDVVEVDDKLGMASRWIRRGLALEIKKGQVQEGIVAPSQQPDLKEADKASDKSEDKKENELGWPKPPAHEEVTGPDDL